jgi:hypothetical protein
MERCAADFPEADIQSDKIGRDTDPPFAARTMDVFGDFLPELVHEVTRILIEGEAQPFRRPQEEA